MPNCNTTAYRDAINVLSGSNRLCGASDWRLPTPIELRSLLHFGGTSAPTIDATWIADTVSSSYWTAATSARVVSTAWSASFNSGSLNASNKADIRQVRLVRGGQQGFDAFEAEGDSVPDAFTIAPQADVPLSSELTSDPVAITGLTTVTVTGIGVSGAVDSSYSINGGPFTSQPGAVANADQVRVRHTSAATFATDTTTTLIIGGVMADFVSTTEAPPAEANVISITADLPDPSAVGQSVLIEVSVTGDTTQPADGQVVVTASTGESCTDTSASAGTGATALFACSISFATVGPRELTAVYSGSATHADSSSAAEPHTVLLPELTMSKLASASPWTVGVTATYTLQVQNTGLVLTTAAATITDPFPVSLMIGTLPAGCTPSGQTVTCTIAAGLAAGASASFVIPVTPTAAAQPSVTNSATVNGGGDPTCPGAARCTRSAGPTPVQSAVIDAVDDSGTVANGAAGGTAVANVLANDSLAGAPAALSTVALSQLSTTNPNVTLNPATGAVSVTPGTAAAAYTLVYQICEQINPTNCDQANVTVTVNPADQAALTALATPSVIPFDGMSALSTTGGSGTGAVSFAVTAGAAFCSITDSTLTGNAVGTCTVTATKAADAIYNAAMATVDVEVLPAADLEISKNDGSPYAIPGDFVEYEILVGNAGPLAVIGARVEDPVPIGLTGAIWTCAPVQGASCPSASGNGGIDQLVDLPVSGVLRYVLSATVSASLGETVTNTAVVTVPDGTVETDASDNSSSDVNTVVADGILADGFESQTATLSVQTGRGGR